MNLFKSILSLITISISQLALTQESTTSLIFMELQKGDSILFEEGFNKCNLPALEKLLEPDACRLHIKLRPHTAVIAGLGRLARDLGKGAHHSYTASYSEACKIP